MMNTTEILRNIPLFKSLPDQEIAALLRIATIRNRTDGELLFLEDQPSDSFLVIIEGQVEVIKALGTDAEWQLAILEPGEYLGEVGLFMKNQQRSASVRSQGPVQYLEIPRAEFQDLLERQPGLAFHIMQEMSQRLRSSENATIRDLRVKNQALQQALEDLKSAQSQLIAQERLEAELSAARKIQQGLLPSEMPSLPGWRFTAMWQPAREVSGDFYDFLTLPNDRLGIVIGDVTGKGMPAALVMATTRSVLHAVTGSILALHNQTIGPGWLLSQVNDLLVKDMPAMMFVTCLIIFLDPESGTGSFANAGHCLPYQHNQEGARVLKARGMPLGLLPGKTYDECPLELDAGDSLLLYSDGLIEAHNPEGEMFGMERLGSILSSLPVQASDILSGEAVISRLLQELVDFSGPGWEQEDDATFVTIERI